MLTCGLFLSNFSRAILN